MQKLYIDHSRLTRLCWTECKLPEVQEPTGEAYLAAVSAILPYLIGHRSRLQAFEAPGSPRNAHLEQSSTRDDNAGLELQHSCNVDDQVSHTALVRQPLALALNSVTSWIFDQTGI